MYQIQVNFGRSHFHNCNICLVNLKDKLSLTYIRMTDNKEIINEQMGQKFSSIYFVSLTTFRQDSDSKRDL